MKTVLLAIGAMLVVAGIVSAKLWRDLRAERLESTQLRTQLTEANMRPRALSISTQPVAASKPAPVAVPAPVATEVSALVPDDNTVSLRATMAAIHAGAVVAAKGFSDADLMKDPEFRNARLLQTRLQVARSNPGLAEALGLSAREADDLFDVMAENQLASSTELSEAMAREGGAGTAALTEVLRSQSTRENPARAVLGEARYAQYQEYQRDVRPALTQVANLGSSMNAIGKPMSDAQNRALTAAVLAEQQRLRQEATMPQPMPSPGAPRSVADTLEMTANRQQASNRRLLEASERILDAAQLDVLKRQFEQQDASRRRSIQTAKDLDAARSTLPQPANQSAMVQ